jgi:SAM-dependent methyltransferase
MAIASPPRLSRQYVKLCDRRDFDDPAVLARIQDIVPGIEPPGHLRRKLWEYAYLTLFLEDTGLLRDDAQILSVGAGHEEVLFWLANRVGRVVATDIYGEGGFAEGEADASMLTDPSAFAPYPYREERLEARWMDARALDFPDDTFDAVFSLSSIEHFGTQPDVGRAAREVGRVLKPGGVAFIVTECFVGRHPMNSKLVQTAIRWGTLNRKMRKASPVRRAVDVFTPEELRVWIVRPSGLRLVQPLDRKLSMETWDNVVRWYGEGRFETDVEYPHILVQPQGSLGPLKAAGAPFTSVALALGKPQSDRT